MLERDDLIANPNARRCARFDVNVGRLGSGCPPQNAQRCFECSQPCFMVFTGWLFHAGVISLARSILEAAAVLQFRWPH